MAVIYEDVGNGRIKAYSDAGYYIHGGDPEGDYADAYDPAGSGRAYVETNQKIEEKTAEKETTEKETDEATAEDYEAALKKVGVIE